MTPVFRNSVDVHNELIMLREHRNVAERVLNNSIFCDRKWDTRLMSFKSDMVFLALLATSLIQLFKIALAKLIV